jgi:hypothetical protein
MNRVSWRKTLTGLAAAAAVALGASRATAAPVVTVEMGVVGTYDPYSYDFPLDPVIHPPAADGSYAFGQNGVGGTSYLCDWSLVVNPDPSITGNFTITNLSTAPQTFILTVTLPVSPALSAPTKMGGSVGLIAYQSFNGNGNQTDDGQVELMTVGALPFYRALIDGNAAGVQDLGFFDTGNICCGANIGGTISKLDFGTPIPNAPGPAVTTSIGIQIEFNVTGGDKLTFPAVFVVAPEPASVLLVGLSLAGLVAARRRSRR